MSSITLTLPVSEEEQRAMEYMAKDQGRPIGDMLTTLLKEAIIEKLEDWQDMQLLKEYEAEVAKGNMKFYTLDEVERELGLTDAV